MVISVALRESFAIHAWQRLYTQEMARCTQSARLLQLGIVPVFLNHAPQHLPWLVEALKRFRPTTMSVLLIPLMIGLERLFETGAPAMSGAATECRASRLSSAISIPLMFSASPPAHWRDWRTSATTPKNY
jgi:hypothetical protein